MARAHRAVWRGGQDRSCRVSPWDSFWTHGGQISGPFVLNRPLSVDSFIPEPVPNGRSFSCTVVDGVPSDATIALLGALS
jgi:hypothetical protein